MRRLRSRENADSSPRFTAMVTAPGWMLIRPAPFQRNVLPGAARTAARPSVGAKRTSKVCDKVEDSGGSGESPAPLTILFRRRFRKGESHDRVRFSPGFAIAPR